MKLLQLYFSFNGRLSLKDLWLYWVIPVCVGGALLSYLLVDVFFLANVRNDIAVFLTWPFLATSVKRLHDRDLSGWFLLLHLIPILGSIILFIPIYLTPGTEGENRFDSAYKKRHPEEIKRQYRSIKIIVFILIPFQIICFFTNKSILDIIYTNGPYYGRVVDAETGEPIVGAAIAGVWEFEHNYIKTFYTFADAKETVTDQDGNFSLPRVWCFTPWIAITNLDISELYVFKSGYDSHPPNMSWSWTDEDEKWRNIEKSTYDRKYDKLCKAEKECIIELMSTQTESERSAAYSGAHIDEVPLKYGYKIRNYITTVNIEGKKIGVEERNKWPMDEID